MSYDISLIDPVTKDVIELDAPHHMRGGTYAVGGTTRAHLNVTWNYWDHLVRVFPDVTFTRPLAPEWMHDSNDLPWRGIRTIYGLTGAESLPLLNRAIGLLGDDVDEDYWKPTEGNVKHALIQLRALASMRPDGVWSGD